ncbi:MAG: cell filamentation protein Fic, partial [Spirochaetes bacterium]
TFEIEEAEEIVFDRKIPADRPGDAHDILGTFNIVADKNEMRSVPSSEAELPQFLKRRHHILMEGREDRHPGFFKTKINRAGNTIFVHPDDVAGTLEKGFALYHSLDPGLQRAVFIKYLISEVHPFEEGNGRISRIMMNAELTSEKLSTIIIPTVYREDYLLALRALTRRSRPAPLVRMLLEAQAFSADVDFSDYMMALRTLIERNWFQEPDNGQIIFQQ